MWEPKGKPLDPGTLGGLNPFEILFEFEEPLTFVCRDPDDQNLLAHSLCDGSGVSRYLVVPTDGRILEELKSGTIDLLGALRQPRCWVADFESAWKIQQLWLTSFEDIPKDFLPKPGAMLTPDLEPLFRLRLVGPGVGPGKTSAADIRMAAQAAESGLRGLARIALDEKKKAGAVPGGVRHFSDLPYLFSRAASFEIAFGRPRDRLPGFDKEVFSERGRLLERGLKPVRADSDGFQSLEGLDAVQSVQVLEVIRALTPPSKGGVERVEFGGEMVEAVTGSRVLTRDDRLRSVRKIKASQKAPRKEAPFRISGVVEEADQGNFSFKLRHLDPAGVSVAGDTGEIAFVFEEHLYDTVMEAFNSLERMVVVGERVDSRYQALDMKLAVDAAEAAEPHHSE